MIKDRYTFEAYRVAFYRPEVLSTFGYFAAVGGR